MSVQEATYPTEKLYKNLYRKLDQFHPQVFCHGLI